MRSLSRRAFAATAGAGCASALGLRAEAAPVIWKWGIDLGAEHPICVRSIEAFARIRKQTNGQFDIRAFPNGAFGSISDIIAQTRLGAIEMCATSGTGFDTIVPVAAMENLAYVFPNRNAAFAAMDGDLGRVIRQRSAEKGMVLLEKIHESGWRDFTTSKKPILTVADLEGLKLRVSPGKLRFDTFRSLGASPTTVASNELYTALQTHIVDAMESALGVIESFRVYEVQKYCSRTHHMWSGYWMVVNADKWNGLAPNLQKVLQDNVNDGVVAERRDTAVQDGALQDLLHRQGLTFNVPSPDSFKARLAASGYYNRWKAEFGDQAWSAMEKYTGKLV